MKWIFTEFKIDGTSCNEALPYRRNQIDCPSMVVFLKILLFKYYHAHTIHHCLFNPISKIGLGFCYSILKGKFLFFNILGEIIVTA